MLRKYATTEILSATMAPTGAAALARYAHRHQFAYEPRPGYLYVRSRAISSRTNDNFDTFPAEEIEKSYASFVGKPVFVNHNNDNHHRARGVVIDAALHRDRNPDGSPDTWVEVLMEVDAVRFPKLAKAIVEGHIDRTSMGTDVAYSLCSFCGNKATTPLEYCAHIPKMKGQRIYRTTASGKKEGVLVSEICHGLKFFENSLLVEEPADPTAFFLGVEGHGMKATARKVAHEDGTHHVHLSDDARDEMAGAASAGQMAGEMHDHGERRSVNLADPHDLDSHMDHHGYGYDRHEGLLWRNSYDQDHPALDPSDDLDRPLHPHEVRRLHDWEHGHGVANTHPDYDGGVPGHFMGDSHFHTAKRLPAGKPVAPRPIRPRTAGRVSDFMDLHVNAPKQPRLGPPQPPADRSKMVPTTCDDCGFQHYSDPSDPSCMLCGGHASPDASASKFTAAQVYAMWTPMQKPIEHIREGDVVISGGRHERVTGVDHFAPGEHEHSPIKNEMHAVNVRTEGNPHGRWAAPGYMMSTYHPDLAGEEAVPFKLDENKKYLSALTPSLAYGEQMAPADVDTLRDEECPVCGEADAFDGNECQVCGFIAPPKMFMDPDLDAAKQQDLRGEMQQQMDADPNGDGMPDVIPGSGNPGTDAPPMDPEQVPDPDDVAQQQVNQIVDEQDPLQPEELDENGQPIMQSDPMAQEMPQDPNAEPMMGEDVAGDDGQGAPGTPNDGVADLGCPACGFSTDATAPQSVDMDTPQAAPGEVAEGALCPQCGQAPLVSLKQLEEQAAAQGLPVAASLFPVIRL